MLIKKNCFLHGVLHTRVRVKKIAKEIKPYLRNVSISRTKVLKFKGTKNDSSRSGLLYCGILVRQG